MDLLALVARLTLDKSEYEQGLNEAESEAVSSGGKFEGILGKVGGAVGKVAKIGAAGIAAGSAVVGVLTKQSVEAYSNYEQLSGGVNKLFKGAADDVMSYANNAYKTAGMSANQYMEQVTGFSASLINSLGGDTKEAAHLADVAMQSMSDNVNTFGSDMSSVQYAFQGFAKQNYTMLDNLKLGYGGTQEEMQRLIADAAAATDAQEKLGLSVDGTSMSFDNIIKAIQVAQYEQGIYGTTANEAATTIEGSLNMTKAAWENLIAGFANPDADLGQLMDNLIVAIVGDKQGTGLLNQVIPAIERALKGIGDFVVKAAPIISERFPALVRIILPPLLQAATSLITGLVKALPSILQVLIDQAPMVISMIVGAIIEVAPLLINMVGNIFVMLVDAMGAGIETIFNIVTAALGNIAASISNSWNSIKAIVANGLKIVRTTISNGFEAVKKIVLNVWNVITTFLSTTFNKIKTTVSTTWNNIKSTIGGAVENIKTKISNGFNEAKEKVSSVFSDIKNTIKEKMDAAKELVSSAVEKIKGFFPLKMGKIFSGVKLPHFNIDGGEVPWGIGGAGRKPSVSIDWYKKAYSNPYLFTEPTVLTGIGFGDGAGAEMVYGHENLMNDIRQAVYEVIGSGSGFTQNITINSPTPLNPSEIARQTRNQTRNMVMRMRTA